MSLFHQRHLDTKHNGPTPNAPANTAPGFGHTGKAVGLCQSQGQGLEALPAGHLRVEVVPVSVLVSRKGRLTTKYGSKYEKARLLGEWANRVSNAEDPSINLDPIPEKERIRYSDPLIIAQLALKNKTMPLGIRRFLPDGSFEDWSILELIFDVSESCFVSSFSVTQTLALIHKTQNGL